MRPMGWPSPASRRSLRARKAMRRFSARRLLSASRSPGSSGCTLELAQLVAELVLLDLRVERGQRLLPHERSGPRRAASEHADGDEDQRKDTGGAAHPKSMAVAQRRSAERGPLAPVVSPQLRRTERRPAGGPPRAGPTTAPAGFRSGVSGLGRRRRTASRLSRQPATSDQISTPPIPIAPPATSSTSIHDGFDDVHRERTHVQERDQPERDREREHRRRGEHRAADPQARLGGQQPHVQGGEQQRRRVGLASHTALTTATVSSATAAPAPPISGRAAHAHQPQRGRAHGEPAERHHERRAAHRRERGRVDRDRARRRRGARRRDQAEDAQQPHEQRREDERASRP